MILPPDVTPELIEELSEDELVERLVAFGTYDESAARHVAGVLKGRVLEPTD